MGPEGYDETITFGKPIAAKHFWTWLVDEGFNMYTAWLKKKGYIDE